MSVIHIKKQYGEFPAVQWLGLRAVTTEEPGSSPAPEIKTLQGIPA